MLCTGVNTTLTPLLPFSFSSCNVQASLNSRIFRLDLPRPISFREEGVAVEGGEEGGSLRFLLLQHPAEATRSTPTTPFSPNNREA